MQQPSVYGALPVGYLPPYNGYSYQVSPFCFNILLFWKAYLQHQVYQVSAVLLRRDLPVSTLQNWMAWMPIVAG